MAIDWKELHKKYGEKEKAEVTKEEKRKWNFFGQKKGQAV